MADARGAWNETGDKLTELGRKLKVHYETQHGTDGQQSRQELAEAARRVGTALQDAFEAIGTAARDKAVQADVKQVGQSLVDALGATLGQASEELRKALSERKGDAAAAARPAAPEPPEPPVAPVAPVAPMAPAPSAAPEPPEPPAPPVPPTVPPTVPPPASESENPPRVEPWGTP
jgi:hypothetical protein